MDYSEFKKSRGMIDRPSGKAPRKQVLKPENQANGELDIVTADETKTGLAELSKADLLKFAGKKKLYDKSFKEIEPAAIIQKILENARAKVAEAGLKTAEEAAGLPEADLFALFDTIGK